MKLSYSKCFGVTPCTCELSMPYEYGVASQEKLCRHKTSPSMDLGDILPFKVNSIDLHGLVVK
jgi:hypothetical protein